MQGKLISSARPVYPVLAKSASVSGAVVLEVLVGKDGRVVLARALSGHPLLTGAARDAVMTWTYSPTLRAGEPVQVLTTVTVNFTL